MALKVLNMCSTVSIDISIAASSHNINIITALSRRPPPQMLSSGCAHSAFTSSPPSFLSNSNPIPQSILLFVGLPLCRFHCTSTALKQSELHIHKCIFLDEYIFYLDYIGCEPHAASIVQGRAIGLSFYQRSGAWSPGSRS